MIINIKKGNNLPLNYIRPRIQLKLNISRSSLFAFSSSSRYENFSIFSCFPRKITSDIISGENFLHPGIISGVISRNNSKKTSHGTFSFPGKMLPLEKFRGRYFSSQETFSIYRTLLVSDKERRYSDDKFPERNS